MAQHFKISRKETKMKNGLFLAVAVAFVLPTAFAQSVDQTTALEKKLLANMHIVQLVAEDFSTQMDGIYPYSLDQICSLRGQNGRRFGSMIPKGMKNPFSLKSEAVVAYAIDPPDWNQIAKGTVVYVPLGVKVADNGGLTGATDYIIYASSGTKIIKLDNTGTSSLIPVDAQNTELEKNLLSNMHTVQLVAEDFNTCMDGVYPVSLEQICSSRQNKPSFRNMIPKTVKNPSDPTSAVVALSLVNPPNWSKIAKSAVVYVPIKMNDKNNGARSYLIYGRCGTKTLKLTGPNVSQ
jgi:hypothetical protein